MSTTLADRKRENKVQERERRSPDRIAEDIAKQLRYNKTEKGRENRIL